MEVDLCDTFHHKEESGAKGTMIEERSASWRFYDRMSLFVHISNLEGKLYICIDNTGINLVLLGI